MRVAHLMGTLNRGGAEMLALDVCRTAAKVGLDILLIHRKGGTLAPVFKDSGIEMVELRPNGPFIATYLFRLRSTVKQKRIDVLHAHQVIDSLYALLATSGMKTKVVLSLHGHGVKDGLLMGILRRLAISNADRIIFVSANQREHYGKRFGYTTNQVVVANGIDFSKFAVEAHQSLREALGISHELLVMGSVGNFSSGRDQLTICRFLVLLQRDRIPFHFVFVGGASAAEPELYQRCVDFCHAHELDGQVTFLGSRSDVPAILPQLDVFIYSTVHDTFGIAVIEAVAAGIPVFVNDWEVMREVTNNGTWATLYASRDESDLLKKFLDFYRYQADYRNKARQHAIEVRTRYGIETHLETLREVYTTLLND